MDTESQFHLVAEEHGFIVVFVDGTDDSPSGGGLVALWDSGILRRHLMERRAGDWRVWRRL